jgi:N-acetylglutamate synthase-like GNAT family acetyltransferase
VIPADRWHEPYMSGKELASEMADGVAFWVLEDNGVVLGVMGIQDKADVALVRHAYVSSKAQRGGVGTRLLKHIEAHESKPILIGTWADAHWAIDFYKRNGYTLITGAEKNRLLETYWSIPARQIETSVVLADKRWLSRARVS